MDFKETCRVLQYKTMRKMYKSDEEFNIAFEESWKKLGVFMREEEPSNKE